VWEAATTVYDPEIPVDIVELGLVYRVEAEQSAGGGWRVEIDMSVTAPFCGMGDILRRDLHDAVAALNGVDEVDVKLVFDPPWDASRLSDVARLELGMM
jgi:metal-sulfur cluster biosynthetic enzyme